MALIYKNEVIKNCKTNCQKHYMKKYIFHIITNAICKYYVGDSVDEKVKSNRDISTD